MKTSPPFHPDMLLEEALQRSPLVAEAMRRRGLCCFYCPAAMVETLAEAARIHPFNLDELLADLNAPAPPKERPAS